MLYFYYLCKCLNLLISQKMSPIQIAKKSNFRWTICSLLFIATMINYMDRQVLSLTWKDYISPEFAWTDEDYSRITSTFSLVYAISMLLAGSLMDRLGTKKGYVLAVATWSLGAMLHAFCGIMTCGFLTEIWPNSFDNAKEVLHDFGVAGLPITTMSVNIILVCRCVLAIGQSGNFPAAVTVTAEYFPKKDRAFAISIFNNGASVGALIAPIVIPMIASRYGWEMAFLCIGSLGYLWIFIWLILYMKPQKSEYMNAAEYAYITTDNDVIGNISDKQNNVSQEQKKSERVRFLKCLSRPETWAMIVGKFMTDGTWWFFLFWTPIYISDFYGYTSESTMGMSLIVVLYLISMLSIAGAYLPTYFINKHRMIDEQSRSRSMLIFALVQLLGFTIVPLGNISAWFFVIIIGILAASHQSWSANLFSMVGDYFPKNSIATVTGIIGCAGGLSSYIIMKYSGSLFSYAENMREQFAFAGYEGKQAAYMILFCCFSVMYLIGWIIMKLILLKAKRRL